MYKSGLISLVFATSALAQTSVGTVTLTTDFVAASASGENTFTVVAWGEWDSLLFVEGVSAMAGFGFDVRNTEGRGFVRVGNFQYAPWSKEFAIGPDVGAYDIGNISAGQVANLFGTLNPSIDLSNPIELFSFDVTITGEQPNVIEFMPTNPNPNGGMSFYPDSQNGPSIIAPNDPDTALEFVGLRIVIPTPATVLPFVLLGAIGRRR
jgi:hypothetical protein